MKVRITDMPVRIKGKRYEVGDEIDVDEKTYKTIKSISIVVEEGKKAAKQTKKAAKKDTKTNKKKTSKKKMKKEDIMIKLAEKGIEFDPNSTVDELLELLE